MKMKEQIENLQSSLRNESLRGIALYRTLRAVLADEHVYVGQRGKYRCWIVDAAGADGGYVLIRTRADGREDPSVLMLEEFVEQWRGWFPPDGKGTGYEDEIALQWLSFRAKEKVLAIVGVQS